MGLALEIIDVLKIGNKQYVHMSLCLAWLSLVECMEGCNLVFMGGPHLNKKFLQFRLV